MIPIGAIDVENETDFDLDLDSYVAQTRFMFERLRLHPGTDVSICFVDEARMSQLHLEWMEEPGATDVLSFPMDELRVPEWNEHAEPGILGDIVLCPAFARRQAEAAGQSLEDELAIDDPQTYRKPFTVKHYWQRRPDLEVLEYFCSDNRRPDAEGHTQEKP